ncbi:MAG: hypothetical protein QG657_5716 [Acidobacteriota bacterium]|nr:hypothetical protein [Acidobacteriota bacterium]
MKSTFHNQHIILYNSDHTKYNDRFFINSLNELTRETHETHEIPWKKVIYKSAQQENKLDEIFASPLAKISHQLKD